MSRAVLALCIKPPCLTSSKVGNCGPLFPSLFWMLCSYQTVRRRTEPAVRSLPFWSCALIIYSLPSTTASTSRCLPRNLPPTSAYFSQPTSVAAVQRGPVQKLGSDPNLGEPDPGPVQSSGWGLNRTQSPVPVRRRAKNGEPGPNPVRTRTSRMPKTYTLTHARLLHATRSTQITHNQHFSSPCCTQHPKQSHMDHASLILPHHNFLMRHALLTNAHHQHEATFVSPPLFYLHVGCSIQCVLLMQSMPSFI